MCAKEANVCCMHILYLSGSMNPSFLNTRSELRMQKKNKHCFL